MKAAVIEKPGELVVRDDVPRPEPGEYEALCELLYGAVCTGTDTHLVEQHPPFCNWIRLPAVLGHESIGRVIRTGDKVRHLAEGDLVTRVGTTASDSLNVAWGGFAEYGIACDWRSMQEDGHPESDWKGATVNQLLPPDTDPAAATMFITWRETYSYVTRMGLGRGARVLVVGSGGNGLAFAAHARNLGAESVVMIGSPGRRDAADRLGVRALVDYRSDSAREQALEVEADGFDFAIDAIGRDETANLALSTVARGGTFGIYGLDGGGRFAVNPNASFGTYTVYRDHYDEAEAHKAIVELFAEGKLDAGVWLDVGNPFTLDTIGDAFEAVRRRTCVKPLVRLRG